MPSGEDEGFESVDAVHTRFREKSDPKNFFCTTCREPFAATSVLDVYEHYSRIEHSTYYSDCLYCHGKVYQYRDNQQQMQYFHNCFRSKQKLDK